MTEQKIKIRATSYDFGLLDKAIADLIETVKRSKVEVKGPIPLPTERKIVTILRAVHKYKDSREQFERRTHKRIIYLINPNGETMDLLKRLSLPSGVNVLVELVD